MARILLPEGHDWKDTPSGLAQVNLFVCRNCDATFTHDFEDQSTHYEPDEIKPECNSDYAEEE